MHVRLVTVVLYIKHGCCLFWIAMMVALLAAYMIISSHGLMLLMLHSSAGVAMYSGM